MDKRLQTGSPVKIIATTSKYFGKTGKITDIRETSGMILNTGKAGLITYINVRLDDTEDIVTFSNITQPLDRQIELLK